MRYNFNNSIATLGTEQWLTVFSKKSGERGRPFLHIILEKQLDYFSPVFQSSIIFSFTIVAEGKDYCRQILDGRLSVDLRPQTYQKSRGGASTIREKGGLFSAKNFKTSENFSEEHINIF